MIQRQPPAVDDARMSLHVRAKEHSAMDLLVGGQERAPSKAVEKHMQGPALLRQRLLARLRGRGRKQPVTRTIHVEIHVTLDAHCRFLQVPETAVERIPPAPLAG